MHKLVLRLPYATPSLNELSNRRGRFVYAAARARWMKRLSDAYLEARSEHRMRCALWLTPPHCRVRVRVERFGRCENALDQDNFVGGLKVVLDALRRLQLIDDDRHGSIELVTEQPKNPYRTPLMWTRVTLERL